MPLYSNRFAGHHELDDPRSLMFAAARCTWPTTPAYRLFFACPSGTDAFSVLRTQGILFEWSQTPPGHDYGIWTVISAPLPFTGTLVERQVSPDRSHVTWTVTIHAIFTGDPAIKTFRFDPGPCNVDLIVGDFGFVNPIFGRSGSDATLFQVEYNETEPPGGWP